MDPLDASWEPPTLFDAAERAFSMRGNRALRALQRAGKTQEDALLMGSVAIKVPLLSIMTLKPTLIIKKIFQNHAIVIGNVE